METQNAAYTNVTVISDDSYSADLSAEEIAEEGTACLLLDAGYLRLVISGDSNSKRSVSNVIQVIAE